MDETKNASTEQRAELSVFALKNKLVFGISYDKSTFSPVCFWILIRYISVNLLREQNRQIKKFVCAVEMTGKLAVETSMKRL